MITPSWPSELHRVRSLNLIRAFHRLGHQVFLFSLLVHDQEKKYVKEVKQLVVESVMIKYPFKKGVGRILKGVYLWPFYPWEYLFLQDQKVSQKLITFAQRIQPDLVYIKRLRTLAIAKDLINHYPTLLDTTDAMSLFYGNYKKIVSGKEKIIGWHEYLTYLKLEKAINSRYPNLTWVSCSQRDKDYLSRRIGVRKIWLWPNVARTYRPAKRLLPREKIVAFSGLMDKAINYVPILGFLQSTWPQIKQRQPQAQLWIIGPRPIEFIRAYDGHNGVKVWGFVPDLNHLLSQVKVYISLGSTLAGSRNKILQAASIPLAIVAEAKSLAGLNQSETAVKKVDQSIDLVQAVVELLSNDRKNLALSRKAQLWLKRNYSLAKLAKIISRDLKRFKIKYEN